MVRHIEALLEGWCITNERFEVMIPLLVLCISEATMNGCCKMVHLQGLYLQPKPSDD